MSHRYGRRDYVLRRALAGSDIASLFLALAIGIGLFDGGAHRMDLVYCLPLIPGWLLLFRAYGLYERDIKRISHGALDDVPNIFHALLIGTLITWTWLRVLPGAERLVFAEVAVFAAVAITLIPVARIVVRRLVQRVLGPERVVFVGDPSELATLIHKIRTHPEYSLEPVGIVPLQVTTGPTPLPLLEPLDQLDLNALEHRHAFERLIVAHDDVDDQTLLDLLQECGQLSIKVSILPRFGDALGPSVEVDEIEGVTVLDLNPLVLPRSSRYFKRAMDIVGATIGLLLAAIPMFAIAIAIKLDSRGPVFFRQERIGRRERRFSLFKFRTMDPDAEERVAELRKQSSDPNWLKLERDPRVTRVGQGPARFEPRRAAPADQRAQGRDEPGRPPPPDPRRGRAGDRLVANPPGPLTGHHWPLAGAGADQHPLRGDGQARHALRHQLEPLARRQARDPDFSDRVQPARRELAPPTSSTARTKYEIVASDSARSSCGDRGPDSRRTIGSSSETAPMRPSSPALTS